MGSADLPEAAAKRQQHSYTVTQRCSVFVFCHANLRMTAYPQSSVRRRCFTACRQALVMTQICRARSSVMDDEYAAK
jgi:hypothetical protein